MEAGLPKTCGQEADISILQTMDSGRGLGFSCERNSAVRTFYYTIMID